MHGVCLNATLRHNRVRQGTNIVAKWQPFSMVRSRLTFSRMKNLGRSFSENVDDQLEQCSPRISGAFFFSGAAERFGKEAAGQHTSCGGLIALKSAKSPSWSTSEPEAIPVHGARIWGKVIRPDRLPSHPDLRLGGSRLYRRTFQQSS